LDEPAAEQSRSALRGTNASCCGITTRTAIDRAVEFSFLGGAPLV
jgi:hypothetical protein